MSFRNGCLFNRDFVFFALNISDMKNSFFLTAFLFGSISVTTAQTLPDPPEQIWPTKKWNFQSVRLNAYYNIYSPKLVDAAAIKLLAADANTLSIPSDLADFNRREDSQQGSLGNLVVIGSVAFSPKSKNDNTINRRKTVQLGPCFHGCICVGKVQSTKPMHRAMALTSIYPNIPNLAVPT
jgi:hypothetical protein